ncbi:MAG: tetratricopeptide repeat protein [Chloroflexaceae bacterium]|nr:tetratricopeptide repeat protein [Chloroflexaceae bacterium]
MSDKLTVIYLGFLLALLLLAVIFVFRQVLKTRQIESTIAKLQDKLKQNKGTAQDFYQLGSLYLDKKLFVQSVKLLQQALKQADKASEAIEPQNKALILNALGYAYFAQEQYDLAIRQYKEALKLNEEYPVALNNLANAYERKQLVAQALETYEKTLKIEPKNSTAKRRAESLRKRFVSP